jgi:ParB-like chromosome segregation protein Spo0J
MEYRINAIADALPMVSDVELQELADDIAANGQIESIKLWNDEIIDGRNRYAACKLAGVEPRFEAIEVDDPVSYVTSTNVRRRHLTKQQISLFIAFATEVMSREESTARARSVNPCNPNESPDVPNGTTGKSDAERAKEAGIGLRTLKRARKMVEEEPETARSVLRGEKPKAKDDASQGMKAATAYEAIQGGVFAEDVEAAEEYGINRGRVSEYRSVVTADPALATKVKAGEVSLADAYRTVKAKDPDAAEVFAKLSKADQKVIQRQFDKDLAEMKRQLRKQLVDEAYEHRMENVRLKTEFVQLFDHANWALPWTEKEYKSLVMFCHPDRHPEDMKEKASTAFQLLKEMERRYELRNMMKFRKAEAA